MKSIVIMESPAKCKTVERFLGENYKVVSCGGHLLNIANRGKYRLGIDLKTYIPEYIIIKKKKKIVDKLKNFFKKKRQNVFLATDNDREGEAIAFSLTKIFKIKFYKRLVFNEITKPAILKSLENPKKELDSNLIKSREARAVIDKMIGYRLSSLLQKKVRAKSAGRVQSVALKLVVEREKMRDNFVPKTYWTLTYSYKKIVIFKLIKHIERNYNKKPILKEEELRKIINFLKGKYFLVKNIHSKKKTINPKNPYIASTLIQDAVNKLNFSAKKTMFLAQSLYEGKKIGPHLQGLITYPRTDSTRISKEFVLKIKNFIKKNFSSSYLSRNDKTITKKNKTKENIQDAHEAVRITDPTFTPISLKNYLSKDEYNLYFLIYSRTLAYFMKPAIYEVTSYDLFCEDYWWITSEIKTIFQGYKIIYPDSKKENNANLSQFLKIKQKILINEKLFKKDMHTTEPLPLFNEASLIKNLQALGIGRPSTYSLIIDKILQRNYIKFKKKYITPTKKGILVNKKLQEFFGDLINENYTSFVETKLDEIAAGKHNNFEIIDSFWKNFNPRIDNAFEKMQDEFIELNFSEEICDKCQNKLVWREGRFGDFLACPKFPSCRFIKKLNKK